MIPYHKPMKLNVDFSDIFESGIYTNAEYCRKLENFFSEKYNCNALVCNSGTTGLILAINSLKKQKYIKLPVFNWFSDLYSLYLLDKIPLFYDVDRCSWLANNSDPLDIRLHTFGNADISLENDCIYDGTHALNTKFQEIGLATIISFAPTKIITAGEGGIILTKNTISEYTKTEMTKYRDRCFRMSEFHAKICLEYLKHLEEFTLWKKRVFEFYKSKINGEFQTIPHDSNHNTIGFLNTQKLLIPKEIETKQYYQPLEYGYRNADYIYKNIICLPSYIGVDYRKIVELIEDANK